ncbi:MAG TPA: UDP-N-acetylglucosamine 1-carboxyvinyltransferase [Firmicutes bacterium]|nr:UDP-N-acetylglucosamine 1-carboxyvinyltransferase [Bacillota bacterium]
MKKIVINGGKKLKGEIVVSGSKNSVVALIPAAILTDEVVEILNTPLLTDTKNLNEIVTLLGGNIEFGNGRLSIDGKNIVSNPIPADLSDKLRASYYFMGALLARFHRVEICFPGGCKIGSRPIDLHLMGFRKMGATIIRDGEKYTLIAENLHGANIYLDFPSVGATVNIILAATLAEGRTTIENAAKEPEIINLVSLLNNMGAKISGAGTRTIVIDGVEKLHGGVIETIPDRIEAGTYMLIGAMCGEEFTVSNIIPKHVETLSSKMRDMGVNFSIGDDYVTFSKSEGLKPVDIKTLVYPGFPTDLGQPMAVLLTQANGVSNFKETIYEKRNGHFPELVKMGAVIDYTDTTAKIEGPIEFHGCEVAASDLRAGAALIIAGLAAKGTTKISNIEHILRGYEDLVSKLREVGADISIVEE